MNIFLLKRRACIADDVVRCGSLAFDHSFQVAFEYSFEYPFDESFGYSIDCLLDYAFDCAFDYHYPTDSFQYLFDYSID